MEHHEVEQKERPGFKLNNVTLIFFSFLSLHCYMWKNNNITIVIAVINNNIERFHEIKYIRDLTY
jgi:hypothetical protein